MKKIILLLSIVHLNLYSQWYSFENNYKNIIKQWESIHNLESFQQKTEQNFHGINSTNKSHLITKSQFILLNDLIFSIYKRNKNKAVFNIITENVCHREEAIKKYQKEIYKIVMRDSQITYDEVGLIGYFQIKSLKDSIRYSEYRQNSSNIPININEFYYILPLAQLGDTIAEKEVIELVQNEKEDHYKGLRFQYLSALNTKKSRLILFTYLKLFPLSYKLIQGDDFQEEIWSLSYYAAREIFKLYCEIPIEKKLYDRFMLAEKDVKNIKEWLEKNSEEYRNIKDPIEDVIKGNKK